jgi:purine-nucleoside phosphorylase
LINFSGMSTVHEVVMARYLELRVFSFSLITNKCPTSYEADTNVNHEEVIETGRERSQVLVDFVRDMVPIINKTPAPSD